MCCSNNDYSDVDWVENQTDASCDDFKRVNIDWEPDSSRCSDSKTSDGDWGTDDHWFQLTIAAIVKIIGSILRCRMIHTL